MTANEPPPTPSGAEPTAPALPTPPVPAPAATPPPLPGQADPAAAVAGYGPFLGPPKQLWIAPQRKAAVTMISIVTGVLLLGIGAVAGAVVDNHHRNEVVRMYPGPGGGFGRHLPGVNGGPGFHGVPPRANAPATPAPSTS